MPKILPTDTPVGDDPGETDNRLSLVPSQFPAIEEWEDGEEYDLSQLPKGTKLRQISPGEFEVIPPTTATSSGPEEETEPKKTSPASGKPRAAMARMAEEME